MSQAFAVGNEIWLRLLSMLKLFMHGSGAGSTNNFPPSPRLSRRSIRGAPQSESEIAKTMILHRVSQAERRALPARPTLLIIDEMPGRWYGRRDDSLDRLRPKAEVCVLR